MRLTPLLRRITPGPTHPPGPLPHRRAAIDRAPHRLTGTPGFAVSARAAFHNLAILLADCHDAISWVVTLRWLAWPVTGVPRHIAVQSDILCRCAPIILSWVRRVDCQVSRLLMYLPRRYSTATLLSHARSSTGRDRAFSTASLYLRLLTSVVISATNCTSRVGESR